MMLVDTYVGASSIEGVGIFSTGLVKAGSLIWRFDPAFDHMYSKQVLDAYPETVRQFVLRYAYPHHEMKDMWVFESDNGRFMNHSDTPNTDFGPQIEAFATRDILPGVEILCNYRDFDPNFSLLPSLVAAHHGANGINGSAHIHRPRARRRRPDDVVVLAKGL